MCYQPKHILNPKKKKNALFDRAVLEVPCGECKECFDARRNCFFIRMYFEHLDCVAKGGFAYFLTLTYRPADINHLPTGELCYRHDDVKNYLKLVRTHLERDFGFDVDDKIRYFCCSEFGEERHRPHYHVIFFVTPPITARSLIYVARKYWKHGFTKPGKYNNGIVQDIAAFSYVSKYCTKGDVDCETYRKLMAAVDRYKSYNNIDEDTERSLRYNCRPVIRTSKNFGLYLLTVTDYNDLVKGVIQMPDKKYTVKNYSLPLYYDRKLFYDVVKVDGQPCYRLNEEGLNMKLVRFQRFKHSFHEAYELVRNTHFSPTTFDKVNSIFATKFKSNRDMLECFYRSHRNDWELLFNYSLVYNGYSYSYDDGDGFGIATSGFDDFNTRLRLLVGLPVSEDELQSLNLNSSCYDADYELYLRIFRYLYMICNEKKIMDFRDAEAVRHRLTSVYYRTQVYSKYTKYPNL